MDNEYGYAGCVNTAPYSFFNLMGSAPPVIAVGILADPLRGLKDSARNILETGEFVVNLVPFHLTDSMNITAIDAPAGLNELALAGLDTYPSSKIKTPRILQSPVALECTLLEELTTGPNQKLIVAQILSAHVADEFVQDDAKGHIYAEELDLVGRLHASGYTRCNGKFTVERPSWEGSAFQVKYEQIFHGEGQIHEQQE